MQVDQYDEQEDREVDVLDAFAAAYSRCLSSRDGADGALDADTGLPATFAALADAEAGNSAASSDSENFHLLERNTWDLIHALYSARAFPLQGDAPKSAFIPPLVLARQIILSDRDLFDLLTVRDWLMQIPRADFHPAEIRKGYLPFSTHALKTALRSVKRPFPRTLLTNLDPDALCRPANKGKQLEPDDAAYEHALTKTLFELVRMGRLSEAMEMCRDADQSWRAASLQGSLLYSDDLYDQQNLESLEKTSEKTAGNINHKLWRLTCRKIAQSQNVKAYERALYGALAGDLDSVLPVCTTWEDQLWAHVNHLLEAQIEARMAASAGGSFFQSLAANAKIPSKATQIDVRLEIAQSLDALLRSDNKDVATGARHPMRMAQSWIIQDKAPELLARFVEQMRNLSEDDISMEDRANLIRFFAHFVLFLREIGETDVDETVAQTILDGYVQVLQAAGKRDLVAMYASRLEPSLGVESYSQYLNSISANASREERRAALAQTQQHGLDYVQVALRTVQLIIDEALQEQPAVDQRQLFNPNWTLEERQHQLIRSIEWLSFERSTYVQCHLQANALMRWFLAGGNTLAAQRLMESLPEDLDQAIASLIDVEDPTSPLLNSSRETADYRLFFACLRAHDRCLQVSTRRPSSKTPHFEAQPFVEVARQASESFRLITVELLESEWLKFDAVAETGVEAESRLAELQRIRHIYIPELVFRLHQVLFEWHGFVQEQVFGLFEILVDGGRNLQHAIDLTALVADEDFKIYNEFLTNSGNRMPEYLERVRECSLAALEYSSNPFIVQNWKYAG